MKNTYHVNSLRAVKSSNIKNLAYERDLKKVFVEFGNGSIYTYENVKEEDFNNLLKAESVGAFFNKNFKNSYKFSKLENTELKQKEVLSDGNDQQKENNTTAEKTKDCN